MSPSLWYLDISHCYRVRALYKLFTAMILRLAYDASHYPLLACYNLFAQLWQVVQLFWPWTCKTEQSCFVRRNLGETQSLPRVYFHPFKAWLSDKLTHITVLSLFILPHLYSQKIAHPQLLWPTYHYWIASQLQRVDPRTSGSLLAASRPEIAEQSTCECSLKTCPVFCSLFCFSFCHRESFKNQKQVALAFSKVSVFQPLILQEKLSLKIFSNESSPFRFSTELLHIAQKHLSERPASASTKEALLETSGIKLVTLQDNSHHCK